MEYEWGINTWNLIEIVGVHPAGVNFFRTVLWCWETTIVHSTFSVDRRPRMCLRVFTLFPESITGCVWVFTLFPESRTGCFWECSPYFGNQEQSVVKSLHSIPRGQEQVVVRVFILSRGMKEAEHFDPSPRQPFPAAWRLLLASCRTRFRLKVKNCKSVGVIGRGASAWWVYRQRFGLLVAN